MGEEAADARCRSNPSDLTVKSFLLVSALLVAVLNGLLLVPSLHEHAMPLGIAAAAIAALTVILAIANIVATKSQPAPPPVAAPPPAAPPANQAEAEVVAFFGLLQEKGRLVDFLMEDITSFGDAQVAAASRVVHQGCREVLREHFEVAPVAEAAEGSQVTVPAGYHPDEFRLTGRIAGEPPFTGTLVHKGWRTGKVKLPRVVHGDEDRLPCIVPAEVELK